MREIDDIHIPFLAWLRELEIPFVYHRPDRKSGIRVGWPDFSVFWMGRVVFIEAKTDVGRLSRVQENVHAFIRKSGNRVEVCRSAEECIEAVKNILCEFISVPVLADKASTVIAKSSGGEARESTINKPTPPIWKHAGGPDSRGGDKNTLNSVPVLAEPPKAGDAECLAADSGEARESTDASKGLDKSDSRGGVQFFIADWQGTPYVFAPDLGGAFRMIREASMMDRLRLPKLP